MLNLKNFKKYKPEGIIDGFMYLISEDGLDWYEAREMFQEDTVKILYENDGTIVCADYTALFMPPLDCSIAEIYYDGNLNDLYGMVFDGEKVVPYDEPNSERIERLKSEQKNLKVSAINELNNLKMAIDLDVATEDEKQLFPVLKSYIMKLSTFTDDDFTDKLFEFPVKPV